MYKKKNSNTGWKNNVLTSTFILLPLIASFLPQLLLFNKNSTSLNPPLIVQHQTFIFACILALFWILIAFIVSFRPTPSPKIKLHWHKKIIPAMIVIFSIGGCLSLCISLLVKIPIYLNSLMVVAKLLPALASILSFYHINSYEKINRKFKLIFYFFIYINVCFLFFYCVFVGSAGPFIHLFLTMTYALLLMGVGKKQFLSFFVISLILSISLLLGKNYIRLLKKMPSTSLTNLTSSSKIKLAIRRDREIFYSSFFEKKNFSYKLPFFISKDSFTYYAVGRILARLDHASEFAYVLQETPSHIPFLYGKTYLNLILAPIPRLFWPTKPVDNIRQFYAHRYHFIGDNDHVTSVSLPILIEAWINFGWAGLLFSTFIFGWLINFVYSIFVGENPLIGNICIGAMAVGQLLETIFSTSMGIGGCLQILIIMMVINFFIRIAQKHIINKRHYQSIDEIYQQDEAAE
jgi:hypothetical protein